MPWFYQKFPRIQWICVYFTWLISVHSTNNQFRIKHVHAIDFNGLRLVASSRIIAKKVSQQVTRLEIMNLLKQTFKTHDHLTLLPLPLLVVSQHTDMWTINWKSWKSALHKPYLKLISFWFGSCSCTFFLCVLGPFHLIIRVFGSCCVVITWNNIYYY